MQLPSFILFGNQVYTYPLFMGLGLALLYYVSSELNQSISSKTLKILITVNAVSSVIGAKILFLLVSSQVSYISNSSFWLGGGYVFYGGMIFSAVCTCIFMKIYKIKPADLNFIVPAVLISHCVGRVGCYLAGCCHGQLIIPIQLVESIGLALGYIISMQLYKRRINLLAYYGLYYSVLRFNVEFYREDSIRGVWGLGLSTSQVISIVIFSCCIALLSFNKYIKYAKSY